MRRLPGLLWTSALVAACSSPAPLPPQASVELPTGKPPASKTPTRKPTATLKRGGGFYKDDGPADNIPDGLDDIPDAEPKWEPLHKPATRPYVVLGKEYTPDTGLRPYKARGIASWYGKKFHGQKTSIGEPYDMFAMTAAHTTLALPSYVRVTNVQTGKSVVVRVTDRGPFHADRIIDLSYTAAYKLGLVNGGSGIVEVESIIPGEATATAYAQLGASRTIQPPPAAPPTASAMPRDPTSASASPDDERAAALLAGGSLPETPVPATPARDIAPLKGVFLQLGAFSNADNAENLRNHLARELDWLNEPMRVNAGGGMHRLHLGPYASRGDADRVAEKIRALLGYKPTVVIR